MSDPNVSRLAYSFREAVALTGLSRASLYRASMRGELTVHKVGRRSIIPAASLAALCGTKLEGRAA